MKHVVLLLVLTSFCLWFGCKAKKIEPNRTIFGDDVEFLKKHTQVILLSDSTGKGQVAVTPLLQGRAITSTAAGDKGLSFGWINRKLISSGKVVQHINIYGGEDRFWVGPEGGQYSVFFKKGVPFDLEHWFTPAAVDTEPFELVSHTKNQAVLKKKMQLENYSGTKFQVQVDRVIKVLEKEEIIKALGITPSSSVKTVAFESINKMTNTGDKDWSKETGLLSIWILGMMNSSPKTTVVVPFKPGLESELGPKVNDAYFGKVPADRLVVKEEVMFFKGDSQFRSKIGITPLRTRGLIGSYDANSQVLTVIQYNQPEWTTDYVNSMWEIQKEPYKGDVINSYNDGPAEPGAEPFGQFYELETSSPAAALKANESISHIHRTIHLQGTEEELEPIAKKLFGSSILEIKTSLPK